MEIKWFFDSCFLIKTSSGKRLLIDPFSIDKRLISLKISSNIISLSLPNIQYTPADLIKESIILNTDSNYSEEFISIYVFNSFCDNFSGSKRGPNYVKKFILDDLTLCHLGNLGHLPSDELLSFIDNCDFLFVPIGGNFCIDGSSANKIIKKINCKYVIPMSFKSSTSNLFTAGPFSFLSESKNVVTTNFSNLNTLDLNNLHTTKTILLLKPTI